MIIYFKLFIFSLFKNSVRNFSVSIKEQKKWNWYKKLRVHFFQMLILNVGSNTRYLILLFFSMGLMFSISTAYAASLQIIPIRLQLLSNQKTASISVNNEAATPVTFQLKIVKWTHVNGKDVYEYTKNILVTPPIVSIQPQQKQIVRLGALTPPDPKKGETYRLIIREVPSPTLEPTIGIQTLLEVRVPVVIAPLNPSKPQILWTANRVGEKKLNVKWENAGESYTSFRNIALFSKDQEKPLAEHAYQAFLLPKQKQEFVFDLPSSLKEENIKIVAQTDAGEISEIVPIVSQ
jgi:fimbrial chaperone protein